MDIAMSTRKTLARGKFQNWAGSVTTHPDRVHYPITVADVVRIVREVPAGRSIRTVGGSHSFAPVAAGEDEMLSLEKLAGIIHEDRERKRVRFLAGTRLHMRPCLHPSGWHWPTRATSTCSRSLGRFPPRPTAPASIGRVSRAR